MVPEGFTYVLSVAGRLLRNMTELLSMAMAMAVDDDMKDDSASPLDLNSIDSNKSGVVLSPEDVAWADSCLINDLAILDHGMDSLKHVLLDTFPSQTIFSAVMRDDSPRDSRIVPTIEETGISGIVDDTIYDFSPTNEQEGDTTRHLINNKDPDTFWSRINLENVFSSTYNEDMRVVEASDSEVDSEFSTFVEENLDDYIFKVWELDIPDEEDELVKQLNKALVGSSVDSIPPASENVEVLVDKLVDDIVSGLDDMSLNPTTD
ncbi:hypothetical protein KY284_033991 [Solanum tuberosum]|nr:hypothetical protein KY284_033991 [Solanum tuberosum]